MKAMSRVFFVVAVLVATALLITSVSARNPQNPLNFGEWVNVAQNGESTMMTTHPLVKCGVYFLGEGEQGPPDNVKLEGYNIGKFTALTDTYVCNINNRDGACPENQVCDKNLCKCIDKKTPPPAGPPKDPSPPEPPKPPQGPSEPQDTTPGIGGNGEPCIMDSGLSKNLEEAKSDYYSAAVTDAGFQRLFKGDSPPQFAKERAEEIENGIAAICTMGDCDSPDLVCQITTVPGKYNDVDGRDCACGPIGGEVSDPQPEPEPEPGPSDPAPSPEPKEDDKCNGGGECRASCDTGEKETGEACWYTGGSLLVKNREGVCCVEKPPEPPARPAGGFQISPGFFPPQNEPAVTGGNSNPNPYPPTPLPPIPESSAPVTPPQNINPKAPIPGEVADSLKTCGALSTRPITIDEYTAAQAGRIIKENYGNAQSRVEQEFAKSKFQLNVCTFGCPPTEECRSLEVQRGNSLELECRCIENSMISYGLSSNGLVNAEFPEDDELPTLSTVPLAYANGPTATSVTVAQEQDTGAEFWQEDFPTGFEPPLAPIALEPKTPETSFATVQPVAQTESWSQDFPTGFEPGYVKSAGSDIFSDFATGVQNFFSGFFR